MNRYGRRLNYNAQRLMFLRLLNLADIHAVPGERGPSLHSFRHSFAVRRLTLWHRERRDVQELLPHLAVYLGHVGPENTYWYLSGTPELLHTASTRFESNPSRRIEPMTAPLVSDLCFRSFSLTTWLRNGVSVYRRLRVIAIRSDCCCSSFIAKAASNLLPCRSQNLTPRSSSDSSTSGKRPRQHRRVSQPATHGDTLLLSHGRIT